MSEADANEDGLRRLFDAGLELALQIQADALAAESADARANLASAFHRVARGVRQTALLQAKLARDAGRAAREARAGAAAERETRVAHRKAAVAKAVERVIEDELDADDHLDAYEDLAVRLETEALADGFLDEPVEDQVARICRRLDLPSPLAEDAAGPSDPTDEASSLDPGRQAPDDGRTRPDLDFDAAPPPDPLPSG